MNEAPSRRILFLTPVVPDAAGTGLSMRMAMMLAAFRTVGDVLTVVLPVFDAGTTLARAEAEGLAAIDTRRPDTHFVLLSRMTDRAAQLSQFIAYGRGSRHAAISAPVIADLRALLAGQDFDLVHVGRLYLADALAALDPAIAATLDGDEDDAAAWLLRAEQADGVQAAWFRAEAEAEDRLLRRWAPRLRAIFIAGPTDRASLVHRLPDLPAPVEVVENALAFPAQPARRDDGRTLLFVGAMGYAPNVEGIAWFIAEVWPRLQARHGGTLSLTIAGRAMPEHLRAADGRDGLRIVADAPDVTPLYAEATLAIAPLFAGRGTRLKIIEAAAHGVPIVATPLAIAGLDFAGPDTLWLADSAPAFGDAIADALADPALRRQKAERAQALARTRHERQGATDRLARRLAFLLDARDHD